MYDDYSMSFLEYTQFGDRLAKLRVQSDISARDLSLSIGQNSHYINHIENYQSYPTMQTFFYICEYLKITPSQFFNLEIDYPEQINILLEHANQMSSENLNSMILLALLLI